MEGRVPPPPGRRHTLSDINEHEPHVSSPPPPPLPIVLRQPDNPPDWDSFVVQFPKEQIYYVPPPEHEKFMERVREKQNPKPYQTRTCKIVIAVIICIIIMGVILGSLAPLFNPKGPSFSISRISVKSSKSYQVTVKAKNPNEKMDMIYESVGQAFLTYKGEPVGLGKLPNLKQGEGGSSNVNLVLTRSDDELPKKLKKTFKDSKPKDLVLKMSVSVRLKLGMITTKATETDVTCNLRVKALGKSTKILKQSCET